MKVLIISLFMPITLLLVNPILSYGQESNGIDKNLENISGQFAECAAYYRLVYHAMISSNEPETANAYRELEDNAMLYSLLLAQEGRKDDVAEYVTNTRIEMYMKKMKQEIDNRNENISILINKCDFGCQEVMKKQSSDLAKLPNAK